MLQDENAEKAKIVMKAMLQMDKIDIKTLKQAYEQRIVIPIIVEVASSASSSEKKPPAAPCSGSTSTKNYLDLCGFNNNGTFVEAFRCTGDRNCCLDLEKPFDRSCQHKGKPGQICY